MATSQPYDGSFCLGENPRRVFQSARQSPFLRSAVLQFGACSVQQNLRESLVTSEPYTTCVEPHNPQLANGMRL